MTQIPAFNPLDTTTAPSTPSRFSEMSSEDFIRVIFTELANQDPLQPNDSSAVLEQLNSIRSIESDLQLVEQLKSLVTENQFAGASNLIGKFVTGLTATNDRVAGNVVSVSRQGEDVSLQLDNGWVVPFDGVDSIHDAQG